MNKLKDWIKAEIEISKKNTGFIGVGKNHIVNSSRILTLERVLDKIKEIENEN